MRTTSEPIEITTKLFGAELYLEVTAYFEVDVTDDPSTLELDHVEIDDAVGVTDVNINVDTTTPAVAAAVDSIARGWIDEHWSEIEGSYGGAS